MASRFELRLSEQSSRSRSTPVPRCSHHTGRTEGTAHRPLRTPVLSRTVCSAVEIKPGREGGWERVDSRADRTTIQDTMDIFISWSGLRSAAVAEVLKKWLPRIVNAFKPWLSSSDIDKGSRWSTDVATRLSTAKAGIICLTPENLQSPWILFEAGALSKTLESTFVCPLLIGLEPSDVTGPLAQFQATRATKDEMLSLLLTLNQALKESAMPESHVREIFDALWPRIENELQNLPTDHAAERPRRTDRALIEELVDLVRHQSRMDSNVAQAFNWTERQRDISFKLMKAIGVGTVTLGNPPFRFKVEDQKGRTFEIELPSHILDEDIEDIAKQQLPGFVPKPRRKPVPVAPKLAEPS